MDAKPDKPTAAVPADAKPASQPDTKPTPSAVKPVDPKPAPTKAVATPAPAKPTPAKADTARKPVTAAQPKKEKTMANTIENTAEKTTDKAQAMFKDAADRAKTAADKGQKVAGEVVEFNKGNIEAMVESSKIAAKGMEAIAQDAMAFAKQQFEDATAAAKTLASAKSPTEFVKLQSDYVRTSFDAIVAYNSRSTERMLKLAGEVAQPLSNRVSLAADKVKAAA